jgi:hypothetical protein
MTEEGENNNEIDKQTLNKNDQTIEHDIEKILSVIQSDPQEFNDLDAILSILLEQGIVFDLTQLSALIGKFLERSKQRFGAGGKITKEQISSVLHTLQTESNFLLTQHALAVGSPQNLKQSQQRKNNLKEVLKRALIYEAYKIVSPRQIAGETAESNLRSNIVMRGIEKALKIEKKSLIQIEKQYGRKFVKEALKERSSEGRSR